MRFIWKDEITFWKNRILLRTTILSWLLIVVTLVIYVASNLPYQRKALVESMESEASNIVTSIDQVVAGAVISEDYGAVVEHCMRVVKESSSILYVVITRNDGFSLVHTASGWKQRQLSGMWNPADGRQARRTFLKSDLVSQEVFHYSYPFKYSGIDWGWIHIGLSLKDYNADVRSMYFRTLWLTLFCSFLAMAASLIFARKLSSPINALDKATQRVAAGDLTARAEIRTGDELERLGNSFNRMTEALQKSQEEIVASREYTDDIIKSMNDALIVTDTAGTINKVNRATLDLLGYTEEELIGKPIEKILAPEGTDGAFSIPRDGFNELTGKGSLSNLGMVYLAKNGKRIPVLFSRSVMHTSDGDIQGAVCIALDITERKATEEALKKAKEDAVRASMAKSQFLANMSHEIRTPMNGVLGMIELLLETRLTDDQRRFAEIVRSSGESLLSIINSILDLSKIEAGRVELANIDFNLHRTVEESVQLLAERAHRKKLDLACRIQDNVPTALRGDPERLRQIVINLIGNAIKFTEQGEVVLDVQVRDEDEDKCELQFSIRDTGIGIKPAMQEKLFQPFTQADVSTTRKHGGTGLGLAIAKQLSILMGGDLHFESKYGEGSTFWLTARFQKQPHDSHVKEAIPPGSKCLRVLVVDDNATTCLFLTEQMSLWGIQNQSVSDSREALHILRAAYIAGKPYGMALIGTKLADMDEGELARAIKADTDISNTRIIMLTPVGYRMSTKHMKEIGVDAFLNKPVQRSQLFDCIVSVLNQTAGTPLHSASDDYPDPDVEVRLEGRVLLAEDNPTNQAVAKGMLEGLGLEVDIVDNGAEAIDAFLKTTYDLIVMDCQMPVLDGYEATKIIRYRERQLNGGKRVPVIALTAHAMQGDRDLCIAAGMDDYLTKPFKKADLLSIIGRWVQKGEVRRCDVLPSSARATGISSPVKEPAPSPTIIDNGVLDEITASMKSGGTALLGKVITLYMNNTIKYMGALRNAVAGGDAGGIKFQAHTMKSSSAAVGAKSLASLLQELENIGRNNELDRAGELFQKVEAESEAVIIALEMELQKRGLLTQDGNLPS